MPSKGIVVFTYISVEGYEVEFTVPKQTIRNTSNDNFSSKNMEMESKNIEGLGHFTGRFEWKVYHGDEVIASRYNDIDSWSGDLKGGNMISTADFVPIVTATCVITYGFYDAAEGLFGLPNRDQCYVTICSTNNAFWMGTVAPPGSPEADKPFSRFVIAAPHDNGMNSMTAAEAVLAAADADTVGELKNHIPHIHWFSHLHDAALAHLLPHVVYGVAITQKKPVSVMLTLGARYFEFRPAKLLPMFQRLSKLPDKFYFQHACIPGLAFDEFLDEQVKFLDSHPNEIVVIHIRHDNIVSECKLPTPEEVAEFFTTACAKAQNQPLTWTSDTAAFRTPISQLRTSGTRIIVITNAEKYDSWTAQAYATLSHEPIIARFESMNTDGQQSTDITVLQCQATSQSIKEVLVYSVLASNAATSCLTSTKAMLDMRTLPWIRDNLLQRLQAERTVVIMNDFIDGATTDLTIDLSRKRLEMP